MTSKNMTRNKFLRLTAGVVGTTASLGLLGCGDDSSGDEGSNDSTGSTPATDSDSSGGGSTGPNPPADSGSSGDPATSSTGEPPADSGSEDSTSAGGACESDPSVTETGDGHPGHELVVPAADVAAGADATYDIMGSSGHTHQVTVTAADFASLLEGNTLSLTSTNDNGHEHTFDVVCA